MKFDWKSQKCEKLIFLADMFFNIYSLLQIHPYFVTIRDVYYFMNRKALGPSLFGSVRFNSAESDE